MNVGSALLYALLIFVIVIVVLGALALIITLFRLLTDKIAIRRKK